MLSFTNELSGDRNFIKSPFYIRYGGPVLLLILVTLFKLWLIVLISRHIAFMLYFGVVLVTSRYFGRGPAILVIILATLIADYFFIPPYYSFNLGKTELTETILFVLECTLILGLSSALGRAINRVNNADRLFKAMIEKSTEGIIMVNPNGRTVYCSPAVENILGFTSAEFLSFEPWALIHPDDELDVKEEFYRLGVHPGKTVTLQHRMKHKNGEWVWIESKTTNLLEVPAVNAVISNFYNVTERILLEKQREDFVGVASHELKTPVTSLKAYSQVLRSRFQNSTDTTSYSIAKKLDQQVNRIAAMITALLDVTTLRSGQLTLNKTETDLNKLVTETAELYEQSTTSHKLNIDLVDIPPINADAERIAQVITNLVSNAIKYSPDCNEVNITSRIDNGSVILYVADDGLGISPDEIDKIFERFYRVDHTKTFQGLGLGLYICSQIVSLHGGKMGVDSKVGEGSTFWFSLPL